MEPSRGEDAAAQRVRLCASSGAGEDRLSALPDDVLVHILLRLGAPTAEAARTSVLSRRWRRVWTLLPELRFPVAPDPRLVAAALPSCDAALRYLHVQTLDAAPEFVAAWLAVAARRGADHLVFENQMPGSYCYAGEDGVGRGALELPCFERATMVSLELGLLGLFVPPAGVFSRLTELSLTRVRFHGPLELGDTVSLPRCPSLQKLTVRNTRGLLNLAIHSESLLQVDLRFLEGLEHLNIDAPALKQLTLAYCFKNQPIVHISAPRLVALHWTDSYDPSSVQPGQMAQLKWLGTICFLVYGHNDTPINRSILRLLERFQGIIRLSLRLVYRKDIRNFLYLMEDITKLPSVIILDLSVVNHGHTFGSSLFHVLRLCTGIKRLALLIGTREDLEVQSECASDCPCDQLTNWKTEKLALYCLQEVELADLTGADHEIAFLERLFSCATVLKRMKITFEYRIRESKARELCRVISDFSRPETRLEFYRYLDADRTSWYSLAAED